MSFIHDVCPECLVGDVQPFGDGHKCNYCGAYFEIAPSAALDDRYWPACPLCGATLRHGADGWRCCGLTWTDAQLDEVRENLAQGTAAV